MTEQTGPAVFSPSGAHTHSIPVPPPVGVAPVTPVPPVAPVAPVVSYTFSDEFDGAAGSPPDMTKWAPQTGRGIWGTGEVENMINSVKTAYLDGKSHLVIACVSDGQADSTAPA